MGLYRHFLLPLYVMILKGKFVGICDSEGILGGKELYVTAPNFLNLGSNWRQVANLTSRLFHPRGIRPRLPLYRKQGGPESWSGRSGEYVNILFLPGFEHHIL